MIDNENGRSGPESASENRPLFPKLAKAAEEAAGHVTAHLSRFGGDEPKQSEALAQLLGAAAAAAQVTLLAQQYADNRQAREHAERALEGLRKTMGEMKARGSINVNPGKAGDA
jgi:hypothetical protein